MKLSVEELNSHYGQAHILFDVALDVGAGEAVALLGRNGAGKSTTFRSIVGLVAQRSGRIQFEGHDISSLPTHAIVRGGLGYVPEERRIFTDLTVEENLEVGRQPAGDALLHRREAVPGQADHQQIRVVVAELLDHRICDARKPVTTLPSVKYAQRFTQEAHPGTIPRTTALTPTNPVSELGP